MRLELPEAISLVLALPAHRSNNEGQRKMGERTFDFLFEFRSLGVDEVENAFNRAMISSVLSAVRAFSVERDRLANEWKSGEMLRQRRTAFANELRDLSPLSRGNYWVKAAVLVLGLLGFQAPDIFRHYVPTGVDVVAYLLLGLFAWELLSLILAFAFSAAWERRAPSERTSAWQQGSMETYRDIIGRFIDECVATYESCYPEETKITGLPCRTDAEKEALRHVLIDRHFYLLHKEQTLDDA